MYDKLKPLLIAAAIGLSACGGATATPATQADEPTTTTTTSRPAAPISDGTHFGYVIVAVADDGFEVHFDEAAMLSGQAAHDAAVEAGVIEEDEDLPNDFFIANDDESLVEVPLAADALVEVISAEDPGVMAEVDSAGLMALFTDTYDGPPVYGIVPGEPIVMNLEIEGGVVTAAQAVYLP